MTCNSYSKCVRSAFGNSVCIPVGKILILPKVNQYRTNLLFLYLSGINKKVLRKLTMNLFDCTNLDLIHIIFFFIAYDVLYTKHIGALRKGQLVQKMLFMSGTISSAIFIQRVCLPMRMWLRSFHVNLLVSFYSNFASETGKRESFRRRTCRSIVQQRLGNRL